MNPLFSLRRIGAVLASAALAAGASLTIGLGTASAHNTIVSSFPSDQQVVTAQPEVFTITFNKPAIATGTSVEVKDAAGNLVNDGNLQITNEVVSQPLSKSLPDGKYTVSWRVTSQDGHPIAGNQSFELKLQAQPAETPAETAAPLVTDLTPGSPTSASATSASETASSIPGNTSTDSASASASDTAAASEPASASPSTTVAPGSESSSATKIIVPIAVLVAGVGIGLAIVLLRRKKGEPDGSDSAS